jgi:translation initiation factor IF-2
MDAAKGATVTLLVQEGTLRRGDALVCNTCFARARAVLNYRSEPVDEAGPSMPVQVLGFSELPAPGSIFRVATSERHARELVEERRVEEQRKRHAETQKLTLESFHRRMASQTVKELPIIIKADTQGTTEALRGVIERAATEDVHITVLHTGAGDVSENDVMLASASNAIIIAFRVDVPDGARALAKSEGVDIQSYDVIYHVGEELQRALLGLLEPKFKEVETGVADVRQVFELSAGVIAGCHIATGAIQRNNRARVLRGDQQVFDGEIQSLRHLKDEVREIRAGFECGILLRDFKAIQVGDRIRAYKLERELPDLPSQQR